jgi:hypothetical protein
MAAWALVQYTARSRRLSDMQFRFAAGVSHDLRTPQRRFAVLRLTLLRAWWKPVEIAEYVCQLNIHFHCCPAISGTDSAV